MSFFQDCYETLTIKVPNDSNCHLSLLFEQTVAIKRITPCHLYCCENSLILNSLKQHRQRRWSCSVYQDLPRNNNINTFVICSLCVFNHIITFHFKKHVVIRVVNIQKFEHDILSASITSFCSTPTIVLVVVSIIGSYFHPTEVTLYQSSGTNFILMKKYKQGK